MAKDGSKLGLGFAGQLRLNVANQGRDEGTRVGDGPRETETTVELRRVRLYLRGSFLDDRIRTLVQFSLSPSSPELVDLWGEYALNPAARLRIGQQKLPFTRHRGQSFTLLPMVEWDIAAVAFGAERQIGFQLHDGMRGDGHVNYSLGIFSGVNARSAFAKGMADTYGESLPNRSSFRSSPLPTTLHPELAGLLGYSSRGMDATAVTDLEGGGLRSFVAISGTWDAKPELGQDFLARLSPEVLLKYRHLSCNLVGFGSMFEATDGRDRVGLLGATLEATYRFDARFELAARYSRVDTPRRLRADARTRAARAIAAAAPAEQADLQDQYANAGMILAREEIGIGFNVYIIGRSLAWQSDVELIRTGKVASADVRQDDLVRARSQLQLAF
ncbi:MAG: hypothetical protein QM778_04805 [Myxococcales bacterium]